MKKNIIVIVGPTSTGKSDLAFKLAQKNRSNLVSADSRQVYRHMSIGTGKDIPHGFYYKKNTPGCFTNDEINIWGYDLVDPWEDYSVSHYLKDAKKIFKNIKAETKVFVVGGTGLYIQGLIDGIETASIPKNSVLRQKLKDMDALDLYEMLGHLDGVKAASLNSSDKKNRLRLMRAIEIASSKKKIKKNKPIACAYKPIFIGLDLNDDVLNIRIEKRILKRVKAGLEAEIDWLLAHGVSWEDQAMSSLGYRQWKGYYEGNKSIEEILAMWYKAEKKFIKRQRKWFKRDKRIKWFRADSKNLQSTVDEYIKKMV